MELIWAQTCNEPLFNAGGGVILLPLTSCFDSAFKQAELKHTWN